MVPLPIWAGILARRVEGLQITLATVELEPDANVARHQRPPKQLGVVLNSTVHFVIGPETRTGVPATPTRFRATSSTKRWQAQVALEFALALLLASGAGLLLASSAHLKQVDAGFVADGVGTARVDVPLTRA